MLLPLAAPAHPRFCTILLRSIRVTWWVGGVGTDSVSPIGLSCRYHNERHRDTPLLIRKEPTDAPKTYELSFNLTANGYVFGENACTEHWTTFESDVCQCDASSVSFVMHSAFGRCNLESI